MPIRRVKQDNVPYLVVFSKNLKFLRARMQLSQASLAKILEITQPTISQYEKNEIMPDLNNVFNICKYFGIKMDDMLSVELNENNFCDYLPIFESKLEDFRISNFFERRYRMMQRFAKKRLFCYYFSTEDKELTMVKGELNIGSIKNPDFIEIDADLSGYEYFGKLDLTSPYFSYINLINADRDERCFIVLPYHDSKNDYIGGIGCILSISTGLSPKPSFQNILLSSHALSETQLPQFYKYLQLDSDSCRAFLNMTYDSNAYKDIKYLSDSKK